MFFSLCQHYHCTWLQLLYMIALENSSVSVYCLYYIILCVLNMNLRNYLFYFPRVCIVCSCILHYIGAPWVVRTVFFSTIAALTPSSFTVLCRLVLSTSSSYENECSCARILDSSFMSVIWVPNRLSAIRYKIVLLSVVGFSFWILQVLFWEVHVYYVCYFFYYFRVQSIKYIGNSDCKNVSVFSFVHSVWTFISILSLNNLVCARKLPGFYFSDTGVWRISLLSSLSWMLCHIYNFVVSWFSTLQVHIILGNLPMESGFIAYLLLAVVAIVYSLMGKRSYLTFHFIYIVIWVYLFLVKLSSFLWLQILTCAYFYCGM
jgi:hypothetical protein